ncbi:unnamed protein product [Linum tenue]|uniref:Uncharacterized protein n=1 Tax=Linum tenue TaxID=586396 RepID=A0AAV0K6C0_9ROSI|nr:unnamed protein product [Linum tenue]
MLLHYFVLSYKTDRFCSELLSVPVGQQENNGVEEGVSWMILFGNRRIQLVKKMMMMRYNLLS